MDDGLAESTGIGERSTAALALDFENLPGNFVPHPTAMDCDGGVRSEGARGKNSFHLALIRFAQTQQSPVGAEPTVQNLFVEILHQAKEAAFCFLPCFLHEGPSRYFVDRAPFLEDVSEFGKVVDRPALAIFRHFCVAGYAYKGDF